MTITSSGAKCDVCGNYILGLFKEDLVYMFTVNMINQKLHSCIDCKKILEQIGTDWKKLPEGPLKKAFNPKGLCIKREC